MDAGNEHDSAAKGSSIHRSGGLCYGVSATISPFPPDHSPSCVSLALPQQTHHNALEAHT